MDETLVKGQLIGGDFGKLLIRQKHNSKIEIGEVLVAESEDSKMLLQVYDLTYGSQLSAQNIEMISGMVLEQDEEFSFMEPELRNYKIAYAKSLLLVKDSVSGKESSISKTLPAFFSEVRSLSEDDLSFMTSPKKPVFMGNVRSGSELMDIPVELDGLDVLSHHILVAATTGRGKSNLTSCILWKMLNESFSGLLVLDPHDEYYGRNSQGLKDHPSSSGKLRYYTPVMPPKGAMNLAISVKSLRPGHFSFVNLSDPQRQAAAAYYSKYRTDWIVSILLGEKLDVEFNDSTLNVLRRRMLNILDMEVRNGSIYSKGVFSLDRGESTVDDICTDLQESRTVIIDTSHFSSEIELLIGNLIASEIFKKYRTYKMKGDMSDKPVISIILEEAPRVLGKDVLERGPNIFSTIAREGRKFKIGIIAITQLPSLIPRDILANLNTKIILGIEMSNERQSIIDSAAQDLSSDSRAIASLDKGEAIITSNFSRFAIPVKFPLFKRIIEQTQNKHMKKKLEAGHDNGDSSPHSSFSGMKMD
ncbi:MAG: ATP-binding protein [Candidatus Woesearchaeota archaeon]